MIDIYNVVKQYPQEQDNDPARELELNNAARKAYGQFGAKRPKSVSESADNLNAKANAVANDADSKAFPKRSWREILRRSRSIDRYFGVDLLEEKQTDPGWLLALWGLLDPRRKVLDSFYRDFKIEDSSFFKRVVADALDVEKYLGEALRFMSGVDNLVVFTSYMVYQLDIPQRFLLVDAVRRIKNAFETRFPGKKFYWFDQGNSVEEIFNKDKRELDFNNLYFSELKFNEHGRLYGRDLARLADDCNSNWRTPDVLVLYGGPSRESLISVKSASTVIDSLNQFGFSCSSLEIPQDIREVKSRVDEEYSLIFDKSKDEWERAKERVRAILDRYEEQNGKPDLAFPYLHGVFGEDGKIQRILEEKNWRYAGCDSIASELGMDKDLSKKIWNAEIPSREYWAEEENNKLLSTYDWDERLRRNLLWVFDRIKIEYDQKKGGDFPWRVVKDESVDFRGASREEKDVFAKRIFNRDSYGQITPNDWSEKLGEMVDVMLRRWEYDVFIYEDAPAIELKKFNFSFKTEDTSESRDKFKQVQDFLNQEENQVKVFIVERQYKPPVLTSPWALIKKDCFIVVDEGCKPADVAEKIKNFEKQNYGTKLSWRLLFCYRDGKTTSLNTKGGNPNEIANFVFSRKKDSKNVQFCWLVEEGVFNKVHNVWANGSQDSENRKPYIFKPFNEGSSFNVEQFKVNDLKELAKNIFDVLKPDVHNDSKRDSHDDWILEQYLSGIDVTVSVLGFGDDLVVLPPLQIRPRNDIYDYEAKYFQEDSTYIFKMYPIQPPWLQTMKNVAVKAYRMLGCRDFTRIDLLMVDDKNDKSKKRFYVLEANTMPGATVHSLTPKSAMEAGFTLPEFFRYVLDKAFYRYSSNYATREIPGQDLWSE